MSSSEIVFFWINGPSRSLLHPLSVYQDSEWLWTAQKNSEIKYCHNMTTSAAHLISLSMWDVSRTTASVILLLWRNWYLHGLNFKYLSEQATQFLESLTPLRRMIFMEYSLCLTEYLAKYDVALWAFALTLSILMKHGDSSVSHHPENILAHSKLIGEEGETPPTTGKGKRHPQPLGKRREHL